MFHRNSFIFLCLILFLSISTPVFAAEEPDLSGGVITSIPRQRFLENINPTHFSTANDPADLISYLQEQLQNISSLTAIVSKDGQTYETELSLSWSDFPEDVTKAGSYGADRYDPSSARLYLCRWSYDQYPDPLYHP